MGFVADWAAGFYYFPSIPGHRTLGIEGKFVVAGYTGTRPTNTFIPYSWASPACSAFGYSHLNPVS